MEQQVPEPRRPVPPARFSMAYRPPPLSRLQPADNLSYMSVKDAQHELRTAIIYNKHHAIPSVRLPPDWGLVHRNAQMRLPDRASGPLSPNAHSVTASPMRTGRTGSMQSGATWATVSGTSSVPYRYQERGHTSDAERRSNSGLNSTYTYYYGTEPLNPAATSNEYNRVGSLSMFGSQAASRRVSSGSFRFGTATRDQCHQQYISPAHLRENLCKFSPGPATYNMKSSLNRQATPFPPHTPTLDCPRADLRTALAPVQALIACSVFCHSSAGAQRQEIVPGLLLWPRGALRPRPPLFTCNVHAGPRHISCLSRIARIASLRLCKIPRSHTRRP